MPDGLSKIHFVGIGGIGMSALAQWYKAGGFRVTGSDLAKSVITDLLEKKGIKAKIGSRPQDITKDTSLVIYSFAVPEENPERKKAKELDIPEKSYAEALGDLTESIKPLPFAALTANQQRQRWQRSYL